MRADGGGTGAGHGPIAAGDGQRPRVRAGQHCGPHHRALLAARPRPDRRQGGLRRGRVRRLLRPGGPARRCRPHPVDRHQRLPDPGRLPRGPGGRHVGGAGHSGGPAPRAAGDGRPGWLTVWILHSRIRLQHGGRVLPRRPDTFDGTGRPRGRPGRRGRPRRPRARTQRLRPARPERQPLPLHRLPADPRRGLRARTTA